MKINAAAGIDGITAKDLKNVNQELSRALVKPINDCIKTSIFPNSLKETRIKALYKGTGSKKNPSNYRPISVLSNLSKIFERLLYQRFFMFLNKFNVISNLQFGFLPNSNTTASALHAITRIQESLNEKGKNVTGAIFVDLSKAFDSIEHEILLLKLERVGIRGNANRLMQEYLFNRRQFVQYDDIKSQPRSIRHGVPQGSCLSSLLYLIYVNDCFHLDLNGYIQMYADDTILIYSCDSLNQLQMMMQTDLLKLNEWMYNNSLSLNASKTTYMIFKRTSRTQLEIPPIYVNDVEIRRTERAKYLGLTIDDQLNWKAHVENLLNTLSPYLFIFKRTRYAIPRSTRLALYYSHFHSHMTYMISLWGYGNKTQLQQLQIMQNKVIRNLFWQEYHRGIVNTASIYRMNNILQVEQLIKYDSNLMIYKIKNNYIRNNMELRTFEHQHSYHTRNRTNFILPNTRLDILRNSMFARGLSEYNSLPQDVKDMQRVQDFKRNMKNMILEYELIRSNT